MLLQQKLTLGITVVAVSAMSLVSVLFCSKVDELGSRLESLYSDALLPLSNAVSLDQTLDQLKADLLLQVAFSENKFRPIEYTKRLAQFQTIFDKFGANSSIVHQPVMQSLLAKHGVLQSQIAREKDAITVIKRDFPLLVTGLDETVKSLGSGLSKEEALARYTTLASLFQRLGESTSELMLLKLEQGSFSSRENAALVSSTKTMTLIASLASIVLGLGALYTLIALLLRPFGQLKLALEQVANGNYAHIIPAQSNDEFGRIGHVFNDMVQELQRARDRLQSYGADLEATVAARTEELERARAGLENAVAERTDQLTKSNSLLREQTTALSLRNEQIGLLDNSSEMLQACVSEAEAYAIVVRVASDLFKRDSGSLYMISSPRNMLEATATWGNQAPSNVTFLPAECWALRRGQIHLAHVKDVRCSHVKEADCTSMCIPLIAQGETLGVLNVLMKEAEGELNETHLKEMCDLAKTLAEHLGLALANLKLRESMRIMSVRDSLTGLYNRRYMDEALLQMLQRASRRKEQVAILMLDIDHFRNFNDSFGHQAGDAVLQELGRFIRTATRADDLACRYGGEEFAIVLSSSTVEAAARRAEEIRQGVKLLTLVDGEQSLGEITVSLGVAIFPDNGTDPKTLIAAADAALYQAKRNGRDRVIVFAEKSDQAVAHTPAAA